MTRWRVIVRMRPQVLIGVGMLFTVACVSAVNSAPGTQQAPPAFPTISPKLDFIFDAAIQLEDLPQGWRRDGAEVADALGVEGRVIVFHGTTDPKLTWVKLSERLLVYDDPEAAANAYPDHIAFYFPPEAADAWKSMPELEFPHHADEMKTACLPAFINSEPFLACGTVARYGDLIVVALGNVFEHRWLTLADFRAVLEAMDERIMTAMEPR